jgi:hypothetical protein
MTLWQQFSLYVLHLQQVTRDIIPVMQYAARRDFCDKLGNSGQENNYEYYLWLTQLSKRRKLSFLSVLGHRQSHSSYRQAVLCENDSEDGVDLFNMTSTLPVRLSSR